MQNNSEYNRPTVDNEDARVAEEFITDMEHNAIVCTMEDMTTDYFFEATAKDIRHDMTVMSA